MSERAFMCEVRITTIHRGIVHAPSQGIASALAGSRLNELYDIGMHVETDAIDVEKEALASQQHMDEYSKWLEKPPVGEPVVRGKPVMELVYAEPVVRSPTPEEAPATHAEGEARERKEQPKRRRLAKVPDDTTAEQ